MWEREGMKEEREGEGEWGQDWGKSECRATRVSWPPVSNRMLGPTSALQSRSTLRNLHSTWVIALCVLG